jgi:hypothetical protein
MKSRIAASVIFFFLISKAILAQTEDFGIWTSIGGEKKLGKWDFNAEAELRTKDNSGQVNRWSLQLEAAYSIIKPLKIGASYQFIYFHDTEYWDFQPRNRFNLFLSGKQKLGNFTFSLRERAQLTTKDASDRIKKSGKINTYKINPEWTWRNRLKVEYNIPKFPVTPSLSFESFYQLNNPDGNTFDDMRYTLSFAYNLTKHNQLEIYGLLDNEVNVSDPVRTFVTGIGFTHSFK